MVYYCLLSARIVSVFVRLPIVYRSCLHTTL
jgi:hypothetical protein